MDRYLEKFDNNFSLLNIDETACGDRLQRNLERTCAEGLKKYPSRGRRNTNYWWNRKLGVLRSNTLRNRKRAQRALVARREDAEDLVAAFKETGRRLKRAIERSKEWC